MRVPCFMGCRRTAAGGLAPASQRCFAIYSSSKMSAVILVGAFFLFLSFCHNTQQLQGKSAFLLAWASDPMCTCSLSSNALGLWAGLPFRLQVDARRIHVPQLAVHLEAFNNRARSAPPSPPYRPAHPPRCFASHLPSPSPLFLGTHTLASTLTPPPPPSKQHQALLFIYERHSVYARLYELVAPAQRLPGPAAQAGECGLPRPGSDVGEYLRHSCRQSTFCQLVVTVARLTDRGGSNFCPAPNASSRSSASQVCVVLWCVVRGSCRSAWRVALAAQV